MFPYGTSGERVDTLDTFSLLRIFSNPSVTMCHLPYTLRCNPRKAGHGKGEGLEDSGCLRLKSVFLIV